MYNCEHSVLITAKIGENRVKTSGVTVKTGRGAVRGGRGAFRAGKGAIIFVFLFVFMNCEELFLNTSKYRSKHVDKHSSVVAAALF